MAQNDFALFQIYSNKLKMFLDLPNHIASANMSSCKPTQHFKEWIKIKPLFFGICFTVTYVL